MAYPPSFIYPDPTSPFEAPLYSYKAGDQVNVTFSATYAETINLVMMCGNSTNNFPINNSTQLLKSGYWAYSFGSPDIATFSYTIAQMPTQGGPICQFVYTDTVPPITSNHSLGGFFNYNDTAGSNPRVWSYAPPAAPTSSLKPSSSLSSTASSTASSSPVLTVLSTNASNAGPLSTGAKAGIGVAIPLMVFLIVIGSFCLWRRKKNSKLLDPRDASRGYEKPELEAREKSPGAGIVQEVAELSSSTQLPQELEAKPVLTTE